MDVCTKRSTYARLKASGSSVDEDKTNLRGDGPPRRSNVPLLRERSLSGERKRERAREM